ncbi:histidine phosphatase family protein [Aliiglaciecola sp. 3_MG-2023]|uniref:SixA phosphatase family protein n=1 Tax=Aliiglaciecola sp. 3_MG-2023 TaxID=3062644 RepID=UPI0026E1D1B5|nr:histidine phosphatase family protein [Aliiglaciecola sp. 3_MG-2023]MDO6694127.1 histidine phosphatase family protein [Aliiglaciecola sp. 3_MG-2023]
MIKLIYAVLLCLPLNGYCYDLYLVRHFEKQAGGTDPGLTQQGQRRANKLAEYLLPKNIQYIYSTKYHRTKQSARPFAQESGLNIQFYSPKQLAVFAEKIKSLQSNALIVGHSNTTPTLISLLGGVAEKIDEDEYGELFILQISDDSVKTKSVLIPVQ